MNRVFAAAAGVVVLAGAASAQDFSQAQITVSPVTDGIYMLQGPGGNLGLSVGEDAVFLVDDQYAPMSDKIRAAIAGITSRPVGFVVNTHWHGDHTGGNESFGESGALIVAHDKVRERMSSEQFLEFFNLRSPASPPAALPVVTFSDRVTLHVNTPAHVIHVPHAHTDGDAIVYFAQANVLHMGDIFFHGLYPFIDVSSGGSIHGMIEGAGKGLALANADTRIIPGHGPLANREDLKKYRDMLVKLRDRVQMLKEDGMRLEQVIDQRPGDEWDGELGNSFIKPADIVTFIYESL
ncbi:MAG: MBL fold metallo-hydrolase [Xanthomonadales bacterium]|nr:MBL fold metallo-hydrolase [Xanthomonadales bacterium]